MRYITGFAFVLAFAVCPGGLVRAQTTAASDRNDAYDSVSDIPQPLRQAAGYGVQFPEQYIDHVLSVIRQNGRDKNSIDRDDVKAMKDKSADDRRRMQAQQIIIYDRNLDGKVTRDEIAATLDSRNRDHYGASDELIERQITNIMNADSNNDGAVTLQEMADYADKKVASEQSAFSRIRPDAESYLALDPNGDGRLTVDELEKLARKAFSTMDRNHNGMLDRDEMEDIQKIVRSEAEMGLVTAECTLPSSSPGDKIVFLGVYEGKAVSTVSVAGQVQETDVIPVDIAPGSGKLYIVASSFIPVIWQLRGQTGRVSHMVLAGPSIPEGTSNNDMGNGKINAGETGVTAENVTFRHARNCGLLSAYDRQPEKQAFASNVLKKLLGRAPDLFAADYSVTALHISDDRISNDIAAGVEGDQKNAPEGFDPETWQRHVMMMPGGVIDLKNEKVVSDAPAVPYEVLPKWAGISKLVHDGAMVPLGPEEGEHTYYVTSPDGKTDTLSGISRINIHGISGLQVTRGSSGYKIVRDIPYYPSRLTGGFSTRFVIAKGVNPPKGDAGHSSVICEETGRPPMGSLCH